MVSIVIGQEAVCPDGLGRVIAYDPGNWIQVKTYVDDHSCKWGVHNVRLVLIQYQIMYLEK